MSETKPRFREVTCPKCLRGASDPRSRLKLVERVYRYRKIESVGGEDEPLHLVGDGNLHELTDTEDDESFAYEVICMDCGSETFPLPEGFWDTADWA
jgi:ribosomal protein S27E